MNQYVDDLLYSVQEKFDLKSGRFLPDSRMFSLNVSSMAGETQKVLINHSAFLSYNASRVVKHRYRD